MRFLHISNFFEDPDTGAAGTIMSFADGLRELGHEVDVLWRSPGRMWTGASFSRFLELPARQLAQSREALAKTSYEVVVVHQPHGYRIFSELAPLYPETTFLNFSHGWELCVDRIGLDTSHGLRRLKNTLADYFTLRDCCRSAAYSHGVMAINGMDWQFLRTFHRLPFERVAVIPLGLDPRVLGLPPREQPVGRAIPRVFYAGNYISMKGVDLMEEAIKEVAGEGLKMEFTCVTHADQHAGIRERLGPALGNSLRVEGWKPRGELINQMRAHDILLFPSRYEGFGKMAHEAMACGMCVVGSKVGVLYDRAIDGENALLSDAEDNAAFTANLRMALTDPSLVARVGEAARQSVQVDTWLNTAQQVERFARNCRKRLRLKPL